MNNELSYKYIYGENAHYYLFLDNVDNIDLEINKFPKAHRAGAGGFLTAFKIDDNTGEVTKHSLMDTRDVKGLKGKKVFQFTPERIQKTTDNEFVLEVYKKKKEDVLIKFTLNNL